MENRTETSFLNTEGRAIKVLNLYAGIGGNRKLWPENVKVTAVELDPEIAAIYQQNFPNDIVIVGDAHQYLLDHLNEYDFVWGSPPCPSHSKLNTFLVPTNRRDLEYPDMKLYQEIILLDKWFNGKWVIENVVPYYIPLIPAREIDRHLFWSNFKIPHFTPEETPLIKSSSDKYLEKFYGFDLSGYKLKDKRKALRNCVHPQTGLHVFNCAVGVFKKDEHQTSLWND